MFSQREERIIKVLGNKKLTIREIVEKVFADGWGHPKPFDVEISVGNTLRRLMEKCEHYNLNWTLMREKKDNKYVYYKEKV